MVANFRLSHQLRITASFGMALAIAAALCVIDASAQQAGINVNVLPVLTDQDGNVITPTMDPDAPIKGDYYLQRQVEPSIAVSTRNPSHVVAFFNDYRAVDIPLDSGLGQTARAKTGFLERFLAWTFRRPSPTTKVPPPTVVAAAEAWVGMARSYDNGLTWSGALVPGAPFDLSPASVASPIHGLEAATDPVVASAPCGLFYVVLVGFTREGQSKLVVARYEDLNNSELEETIVYHGTTVAEVGQNDGAGHFHDKPAIAVDHARGTSTDPCGHNVYIAWARFNGNDPQGKFHSIMNFMRSTDKGLSFTPTTPVKLDGNFTRGQGAAIAVDPRPGTPTTTGGGTVYVGWRHFSDPATILLTKSTDFGATFPGQPLNILGQSQIQTFDQPSLPTTSFPPGQIAYRSNGLPTLAVTGNGTVFAAWQERVNISDCGEVPGPLCGKPAANGSPRIVLVKSGPGGSTWTNATGGAVALRGAVDFGDRDDPVDPNLPAGFGTLPMSRPSGPQVMPKLMFGGDRLLLTYFESRGILAGNDTVQLADLTPPAPGFISGIGRWMDVRSALLNPATGGLEGTAQVSRYPLKNNANLTDGETLGDVQAVNAPCSPDSGPGLPPCVRRVNRVGGPTSASGTTPFIGDYIDTSPIVQFVPVGQTAWKWAIAAADVPYRAFRTIFTDLRNQVPPTHPANLQEWQRYPFYSVPGSGGTACNAGSRNADVLTSLVNAELVVSAPVTFKQLGLIQVSFPVLVQNNTNGSKFFRLTITSGATVSSFDQISNLDSIDTEIYKSSSVTRVVYVQQGAPANTLVQVSVQEITGIGGDVVSGGLSGTATINGDPSTQPGDPVTTETHNPQPFNPQPFNPQPFNPQPFNVPIFDTTAKTFKVTNEGNTQSAYSSVINVDDLDGVDTDNLYQIIVWTSSSSGTQNGCDAAVVTQSQILVNITNPQPFNPQPFNPQPFNPQPFNATFTVAPADTGSGHNSHDGTTHAAKKAGEVFYTVIAHQKKPNCPPGTDTDACVSPSEKKNFNVNPPSLTVFASSCDIDAGGVIPDGCQVAFAAPDFVPLTPVAASPTNPKRRAFVKFPAGGWTLKNIGTTPGAATDGAFTHNIYLSVDATVGPGDILLGVAGTTTGALAAGATQTFPEPSVRIPVGTVPGAYHLCLSVDDFREVSEFREVNNFVCVPITVAL